MDQINKETQRQFDDLVEETRREAIRIMKVEFPKKLVVLNEMAASILTNMEPFLKSIDMDGEIVPANDIVKLLESVKTELWDLINYVMTVKFFIKLNQPRKEDGNTFGVEVQNEIISDMNDAMDGARQLLTDMISYFSTRASIIAAVGILLSRKNPHVSDFVKSAVANDNKEILVLSQAVIDMRNQYAVLYDRVMKNFDKIVKPTILTAGLKWDSMY